VGEPERFEEVTPAATVARDGVVYVGTSSGRVYALDGQTGQTRWTYKSGSNWKWLIREGIRANASLGQLLLRTLLSPFLVSPVLTAPIIGADGALYVVMHGELHAIE